MKQSFLACIPLLAAAVLLTGCPQHEPPGPPTAGDTDLHDGELRLDPLYYDSIEMHPQSARTQRQLAISTELHRLEYATKPLRNKQGQTMEEAHPLPAEPNDSFYTRIGDGPLVGFANKAQELADIHRKIDSLKVLEHIPLTPH